MFLSVSLLAPVPLGKEVDSAAVPSYDASCSTSSVLPSYLAEDSSMKIASTGPGVFVRKATMWDAFWMNSIGMALGIGVGLMFFQGPYLFPGGDAVIATLVTTVVTAFTFIYVYSKFSAAMPRSGGDYVFVSRALHPF